MSKLKPCPFCGGEAAIYNYEKMLTGQYKMVECKKCHCTSEKFKKVEDAIAAWNTRKPMENIVKQLENHIRYCELCHEEFNNSRMSLTYEVQLNSYKNAIEIVKEEGGV